MSEIDPRVASATFPVWLSREMTFNNPPGQNLKTYPKHTKAEKIKYTKSVASRLEAMENRPKMIDTPKGKAVAIKLDGKVRYVWREDVLTEREYDEVKAEQKAGIGMLFKKLRGDVGQGGSE